MVRRARPDPGREQRRVMCEGVMETSGVGEREVEVRGPEAREPEARGGLK